MGARFEMEGSRALGVVGGEGAERMRWREAGSVE